MQVLLEVAINSFLERATWSDLIVEEHAHAAPCDCFMVLTAQLAAQLHEPLTGAQSLHRGDQAHHRPGRRLGAKYRRRSKRSNHFIVTHVNNPQVPLMLGALDGDWQDDIRVNGGVRRIGQLEFYWRVLFPQQHLPITARWDTLGGGTPRCGRAPEDKTKATAAL